MINQLIDTNPAPEWAMREFRTSFSMVGGHTIRVKFKGNKICKYDYEDIITTYGDYLVVDPIEDYGEYLCRASSIAAGINQRIAMIQGEVKEHVVCTVDLLHALASEDYGKARECIRDLSASLKSYNKEQIKTVWSKWIMDVMEYLDSRNALGIDEIM